MLCRSRIVHRAIAALLGIGLYVGAAVAADVLRQPVAAPATVVPLPNQDDSLKFVVLGDFGTGERPQYELAAQMEKLHQRFPYQLVVTVGDNLYGSQGVQDFKKKFEDPYKPLLDANVKFYASIGNHDDRAQRFYKLFNMDGKFYYSFKPDKQDVRFFALDSTYRPREQIQWLEKELQSSDARWKIPYFHHPMYSSGDRHGSDEDWREAIEPLFVKYNVSVVFAGHDHFYERIKPQKDIVYFVVGSGGQLRRGNIDRRSGLTAQGFDTDQAFLVAEILGDEMFFNAISRQGQVVDSGVIQRRKPQ